MVHLKSEMIHLKSTLRGSGTILKSDQNTKMQQSTQRESPYLPEITLDQSEINRKI